MTNLVLIVMDTARADLVGVRNESTPMTNLRDIAKNGINFSNTHASAPWTLPSHGTLFSGQYPSVHKTHAAKKSFEYSPTLSQILSDYEYNTVAVSNNTWISEEFGFDRGFQDFISTWQLFQDGVDFGDIAQTHHGRFGQLQGIFEKFRGNPFKNLANLVYGQYFRKRQDDGARRTNKLIQKELDSWLDNDPLFLFVNYLEPHLEYRPPRELARSYLPEGVGLNEANSINQDAWAYITGETEMDNRDFEILQGLYEAELAYLDKRIGELIDIFEDAGVAGDTTFIITSDHGENIGDHGLMDHQYSLHETLLHVPLVISGPEFDAGHIVEKQITLADIFPTIIDIADIKVPEDLPGYSLRKYEKIPEDRSLFAEYIAPQPPIDVLREQYDCKTVVSEYDRLLRSVQQTNWKYIRGSDGSEWLFNLEEDPYEYTNRIEDSPEKADKSRNLLESWENNLPEITDDQVSISAVTEDRLEDLGYLQ